MQLNIKCHLLSIGDIDPKYDEIYGIHAIDLWTFGFRIGDSRSKVIRVIRTSRELSSRFLVLGNDISGIGCNDTIRTVQLNAMQAVDFHHYNRLWGGKKPIDLLFYDHFIPFMELLVPYKKYRRANLLTPTGLMKLAALDENIHYAMSIIHSELATISMFAEGCKPTIERSVNWMFEGLRLNTTYTDDEVAERMKELAGKFEDVPKFHAVLMEAGRNHKDPNSMYIAETTIAYLIHHVLYRVVTRNDWNTNLSSD